MIISSALRSNAGYFHCTATNLLGETESERHQIDVLCKYTWKFACASSSMTITRLNP